MTHRLKHHTLSAALVVAASCGSSSGESEPAPASDAPVPTVESSSTSVGGTLPEVAPNASLALMEEAVETAGVALQMALFFDDDPIADVGVTVEMYTSTIAALDELSSSLPATTDVNSAMYAPFLEAIDIWRSDAASTLTAVESRQDELQQANDEYRESGVDGPPPGAYVDLIDVNFERADSYQTACTEVAVDLGVALNCLAPTGPPPDPDGVASVVVDGGALPVELGTFFGEIEAGPVEDVLNTVDFVGIDFGSTLSITTPPDVVEPSVAGSDTIPAAMGWPDDLVAWSGELPDAIVAIEVGTADLGPSTWRVTAIESTSSEGVALITNPVHPEGAYVHNAERSLRVWETSIDGQAIVAILQVSRPGADPEAAIERAETILASLVQR